MLVDEDNEATDHVNIWKPFLEFIAQKPDLELREWSINMPSIYYPNAHRQRDVCFGRWWLDEASYAGDDAKARLQAAADTTGIILERSERSNNKYGVVVDGNSEDGDRGYFDSEHGEIITEEDKSWTEA